MRADPQVLHLRSSAGLYGAEYVILGLVPALADIGVECSVLSLDNPHLPEQLFYTKARALGLRADRVPCRGRFDFATVQTIRRTLASYPGSVLHVHDYKSAVYAWLARAGQPTPIVITAHGQFSFTAALQLYHRIELRLMQRFDRVCAVSADMQPWLERAGVPPAKIRLIENGIDTKRFTPDVAPLSRIQFGIAENAALFGAAMRLTDQKNPLGLITAFAQIASQLPNAELVIAGDGPLRDAISSQARALGIDERVHLLGVCGEIAQFYTMLDVFVLPSHYEGLPLALLEAMAAGRRIVATCVGQVAQVLDGLDAQIVPPGDECGLADAMYNAALHRSSTARLRRRVVERYSTARMAVAYARVYDEIWSRHGRLVA